MHRWMAVIAAAAATGAALGQVPADIAAAVRAGGQVIDPSIGKLYAPLFGGEPWAGAKVTRDLAYGSHAAQKLDIFEPASAGTNRPVLLFVHGGGFVRGDKHGQFYPDNITLWAARNGMVGVNINYRLAPGAPWPAGVQDLRAAIAWTQANIARFGGDPARILIFGHSAGANHVSDYVAHPELQGAEAAAIRGAILLSPFYAAAPDPARPHAYYGRDAKLQSAAAAMAGLRASTIPLFVGGAQYDPAPFKVWFARLRAGLCAGRTDCRARFVRLADHNHMTEGMALGTNDQSLAAPLLDWIHGLPGF